VVVCGDARPRAEDHEIAAATVVVEVISRSTAQIDDTRKRWGYMSLPMLAHDVLVNPLRMQCAAVNREPDGSDRGQRFAAPDDLPTLRALRFSVRLRELYRDDGSRRRHQAADTARAIAWGRSQPWISRR
jgi:hypothetical protein